MDKVNWKLLFDLNSSKNLEIHTGNVIDELKRKTALNSTEELLECIGFSLSSCGANCGQVENGTLVCVNDKHPVKISKDERKDMKLTVKIFLSSFDTALLKMAVDKALNELGVTYIESVITAFPPSESKLTLEEIIPLWKTLETLVEDKKILAIGISDLDTELLIKLHKWAQVKPIINQINLASCCVIPEEMQQFAKENDIQLLTHNDPKDLLSDDQLNQWITSNSNKLQGVWWKSMWIVRFSALVKCRGVIQNKGYIVSLKGNNI